MPPRKPEMPDEQLFAPLGTSSYKVYCLMCGPQAQGFVGGRWMERHRYGHGNCPRCGAVVNLNQDGRPRRHSVCPKKNR